MQKARFLVFAGAIFLGVGVLSIALARGSAQAGQQGATPPSAAQTEAADPGPRIPDGFTPIFNGKDLSGWHVSKTNHHGTTPDYRVLHGLIVGTQNPKGQGGILLTDKKYKNFEVYIEIKPDWGCDSGLFLRSSEAGEAYQVTLDYLPNGGMGGIYGERLKGVQNALHRQTLRRGACRAGEGASWNVAEGVEARSVELGARAHRRRRAADHRLDQRSAHHRVHRYGEPRGWWRNRRHDRHPDALQQREDATVGRRRILALADHRGQRAAGAIGLRRGFAAFVSEQ